MATDHACQECGRNAATRDHDVFMRDGKPICLGCMISEHLTQRMLVAERGEPLVDSDACLVAEPLFTLTETLPTEDGWYWRKPHEGYLLPFVVQVMRWHVMVDGEERIELCVYNPSHRRYCTVVEMGGLWAGPIPKPVNA